MNGQKDFVISLAFTAITFAFGTGMFVCWLQRLAIADSPVITGTVTDRTPVKWWGMKRTDLTIELDDHPQVFVHAITQRNLIDHVPRNVRFHYSGDPTNEVFLYEHEDNPLWIALFSLFGSALFACATYRCLLLRRKIIGGKVMIYRW